MEEVGNTWHWGYNHFFLNNVFIDPMFKKMF